MFERIAQDTRRVLQLAQQEAQRLGHRHIGTEHLLLGVLGERRSYGATVLLASGLRPEHAAQALANADARDEPVVDCGLTARAGWVLGRSFQEAVSLGGTSVRPEHLLLALIADERGLAGQVLRQYAPSLEDRILPRHRFTPTPHTAALRTSTHAALSEPAREVMQLAQDEAARLKHNYIGTEHLLLGLLRQDGGAAAQALADLGVSAPKVRLAVEFIIGKGDREIPGPFNLTPRATRAVELSLDEAHRLGRQTISSGHLLLGLVREGEGVAASVLESMTATLGRVREHVLDVLQGPQPDD